MAGFSYIRPPGNQNPGDQNILNKKGGKNEIKKTIKNVI